MPTADSGRVNAASIADHLDKTARGVRGALWRLENPAGGMLDDPDVKTELEYLLKRLYIQVMMALDDLGLAASRSDLGAAWDGFVKSGLRKNLVYYPEADAVGSEAYDYLDAVVDGIRAIQPRGLCAPRTGEDPDDQRDLLQLEKLLDRTAYILQKRSVVPRKEADVQHVMDEYLEAIYGADYRRQFSIPGVVKNFKPDSGIISLGAVVEFKFAANAEELKKAISGLFEDAGGYKASKDWREFYSVIFMTGAYGTKEQLLATFERADMIRWTPVPVIGHGGRSTAKKSGHRAKKGVKVPK